MSQSLSDILKISKFKEVLADYVRVKVELLKLDLTEHISDLMAQVIAYLIIFLMAMFVLTFASIATANALNDRFESSQMGYWIVSAFYLLILLIILYYLRSGKLKKSIESKISETQIKDSQERHVK